MEEGGSRYVIKQIYQKEPLKSAQKNNFSQKTIQRENETISVNEFSVVK